MIIVVLQARASSSRLPGKVLKPILGKPMLLHQIERIQRAKVPARVVLATSRNPEDDAVAHIGQNAGIVVYRGDLDDVLDRFYRASEPFAPSHVVRLTGDCPLTDPGIIDAVTRFAVDGNYDYASNSIRPTFPDGLDVEVATFEALQIAWREATTRSDREHVMPFLHRQSDRFTFVEAIYQALYPAKSAFDSGDVLAYLEANPSLAALNSGFVRNEGFKGE